MSERIVTYLKGELLKQFRTDMKRLNLTQADLARKMIADNYKNQYAFLIENPCPLRDYLGEDEATKKGGAGWYCMKKAPALTKLGSGIESAAEKICGKCKIRDEALEDSKTLREQQKKGIVVMIHSCKKGAKTNEDMTEMYCPELGNWRPIMKKKKKTDYVPCRERGTNKARCIFLVSTQTVISGKLPAHGQNL